MLQVLADGLELFRMANTAYITPNAPLPMPLLGPLEGTTLFASPLPRFGQRSIRFGEIVRVVCAGAVKRELSRLMGQESTLFGRLDDIKLHHLIKLASGTAVVPWTNTQDGFCRVWERIHSVQRDQMQEGRAAQLEKLLAADRHQPRDEDVNPDGRSDEGVPPFGHPPASAEPPSGHPAAAGRDEVSASVGLQRACDTIGRVLVCAGVAMNHGVFMVMTDVSEHPAVTMEHVADWSTFFTQIVEDFLLPLAIRNIVYFDLRPGCSNLRVTRDSQYIPLDIDSLILFGTECFRRDGRYPHQACDNAFAFVYVQVLLVAFCASLSCSDPNRRRSLHDCEAFFHSVFHGQLVPWGVPAPTRQSLQMLFDTWMSNQARDVLRLAAPVQRKMALTEGDVRQLRNLSITSDVNVGMLLR